MNNRLKELAEQAEIKFEYHPQHQGVDTAVIIPTDLEKFAELIVRECSKVNNQFIGRRIGEIDLDLVYNEHLGVK